MAKRKAQEDVAYYDLNTDDRAKFITLEKTKAAMNGFSPHKAVGTDDLPPIIYQNFGPAAWDVLHKIYQITFLLGLLPLKWLDIRVIFIPKPGKGKYNDPGSWRPISLMQYMMKGCEKVVIWDNELYIE